MEHPDGMGWKVKARYVIFSQLDMVRYCLQMTGRRIDEHWMNDCRHIDISSEEIERYNRILECLQRSSVEDKAFRQSDPRKEKLTFDTPWSKHLKTCKYDFMIGPS